MPVTNDALCRTGQFTPAKTITGILQPTACAGGTTDGCIISQWNWHVCYVTKPGGQASKSMLSYEFANKLFLHWKPHGSPLSAPVPGLGWLKHSMLGHIQQDSTQGAKSDSDLIC
jgi:hypothetical protein